MARHPTGEVESFTYDEVGNLLTRTDSSGTTVYTYYADDRLESVTDPTGTTIVYHYDKAGELTDETIDGQVTTVAFDAAGRLETYTDSLGIEDG